MLNLKRLLCALLFAVAVMGATGAAVASGGHGASDVLSSGSSPDHGADVVASDDWGDDSDDDEEDDSGDSDW